MNRITQLSIFENNQLGDLEKLNDVLNALPDEKLIALLEEERGKGRNDYPVFTMWRAFLAINSLVEGINPLMDRLAYYLSD